MASGVYTGISKRNSKMFSFQREKSIIGNNVDTIIDEQVIAMRNNIEAC